jgi:CBS-domain-containing membrane protein
MYTFTKSLQYLRAADLMKKPVQTVPQEMSLPTAGGLLQREQISGAAVIDGAGRCVGVISTTDFLNASSKTPKKAGRQDSEEPVFNEWQVDVDSLPADEVRNHMSRDVVTVTPATPITELARSMLDAHIHRVFVVDEERRPVGIVSSTDIVAAVAYAEAPRPERTAVSA